MRKILLKPAVILYNYSSNKLSSFFTLSSGYYKYKFINKGLYSDRSPDPFRIKSGQKKTRGAIKASISPDGLFSKSKIKQILNLAAFYVYVKLRAFSSFVLLHLDKTLHQEVTVGKSTKGTKVRKLVAKKRSTVKDRLLGTKKYE